MEDFLRLIVKCFPMATFILFAASCTSKRKESQEIAGRKLTLSTSSFSSENENGEELPEQEQAPLEFSSVPSIEIDSTEERKEASGNKKETGSPSVPLNTKSEETPEKKKEEAQKEQDVALDETNPHFAWLLGPDKDLAQAVLHSRFALEQTACFQWTMKKRLSFDEGCWKHLSRRISSIKAEGLDVRVNTRRSRDNKKIADRETKLDVVFAKWAAGKPKRRMAE